MIIHNDLEQGTQQWKEARLGKITASSSECIMVNGKGANGLGAGAITYAEQLVNEIICGPNIIDSDPFISLAMEWGNHYEIVARDLYKEKRKVDVTIPGGVENGEFWYSPDGFVGTDGLIEIKAPQPKQHIKILRSDVLLKEYVHQCQFALWITGREWLDWISFNPVYPDPYKSKVIRVLPELDYHAKFETKSSEMLNFINQILKELNNA